jgi:hypothetical protein
LWTGNELFSGLKDRRTPPKLVGFVAGFFPVSGVSRGVFFSVSVILFSTIDDLRTELSSV